MRHRLKPEDATLSNEEVAVRLNHFGAERRRELSDIELDAAADGSQVTHVARVEIGRVVVARALRHGRCTRD